MTKDLRERLIGAWKLVYVEEPVDGYMSAQLAKPNRGRFISGDWLKESGEEYRAEASCYIAYTRPFHVDEE